jgi:hypothetical protein
MTFDPTTDYKSEWRWRNGIENYTYAPISAGYEPIPVKVQWSDLTKPDITGLPGGLSLDNQTKIGTVWNATDDADFRDENGIPAAVPFDPREGDVLTNANGGWTVGRVIESRFGQYILAVVPERRNVTA